MTKAHKLRGLQLPSHTTKYYIQLLFNFMQEFSFSAAISSNTAAFSANNCPRKVFQAVIYCQRLPVKNRANIQISTFKTMFISKPGSSAQTAVQRTLTQMSIKRTRHVRIYQSNCHKLAFFQSSNLTSVGLSAYLNATLKYSCLQICQFVCLPFYLSNLLLN